MQTRQRPTGVTIIAILTIIVGILLVVSGAALIAIGLLILGNHFHVTTSGSTSFYVKSKILGIFSIAVGTVLLAIGIVYVVMFYGLLKGKRWAWSIAVILLIAGIVIHIISTTVGSVFTGSLYNGGNITTTILLGLAGAVIGISTNIVTLYYLYRPFVKIYFGKTPGSIS